ncbi:PepSY-associated TM helix domain-containing protein [Methylosinus sporium]|uniref:PepSY-associated TM helix domain-containing protein n=1 Tax=Methylosinus sporium TaxID=428 RepID=UPI003839D228
MNRAIFVWLHRWAGLAMAAFLIVVGLTGSMLAFLPELDHFFAPEAHPGRHAGVELEPAELLRRAEAIAPEARVNTVYLGEEGVAQIGVDARPGEPPLPFDSITLDRVTGEELGDRIKWNGLPTSRAGIMPFVYSLHYELAMGGVGAWILGVVALVWTIDCFVAFYLTLPLPSRANARSYLTRWRPAWLVKTSSSFYRLNFDLHRAGGLWMWGALLIFAWSSVYMDLNSVYARITSLFFHYEQPTWAATPDVAPPADKTPLGWEIAQATGARLMSERAAADGFSVGPAAAFYLIREKGVFEYRVHSSRDVGDRHGATSVVFDAYTGELRRLDLPTGQHSGNTITAWLVALHMASVFGLPYRIFVCALGLVIAMLSVTGVYIWWKKRAARKAHSTAHAFLEMSRESNTTGW